MSLLQMELPATLRPDFLPAPLPAVLCICLALAVWIKILYGKLLTDDAGCLLGRTRNENDSAARQHTQYRQYRMWAILLFLLNSSVAINLCNMQHPFSGLLQPSWLYLTAVTPLACGIFFLLKTCLAAFFGWIWQAERAFGDYTEYMWISLRIMGFCLLGCIWSIPFLPPPWSTRLMMATGILYALLMLARWIKGFVLIKKYEFSVFCFISYLCTAEFIPILLFWKVWK